MGVPHAALISQGRASGLGHRWPSALVAVVWMAADGWEPMIPMRSLLLSKLLRSSWTVAAISLMVATLLEWGLMAQGGPDLLQAAGSD